MALITIIIGMVIMLLGGTALAQEQKMSKKALTIFNGLSGVVVPLELR